MNAAVQEAVNLPRIFKTEQTYEHRKLDERTLPPNWLFKTERQGPDPEEKQKVGGIEDLQQRPGLGLLRQTGRAWRRSRDMSKPVIDDLDALREEEQTTEEPVTDFAYGMAKAILKAAYNELNNEVPLPAIAPDSEGGIWIEWLRPGRNLRVVIPGQATQRAYIYHRINEDSDIHRLSGAKLAELVKTVILTA